MISGRVKHQFLVDLVSDSRLPAETLAAEIAEQVHKGKNIAANVVEVRIIGKKAFVLDK